MRTIAAKTTYAGLLASMCLALVVRYPQVPHGVGIDSFFFEVLSLAIANKGQAAWIVNPLSPFGLYPLSYPSGSFFLVAEFAEVSSAPVEFASLMTSSFFGVAAVLTGFVMARGFSNNRTFDLGVSLLFALMPTFVMNTLWEVPARGLLMLCATIFIWATLRTLKTRRTTDLGVASSAFLLMALSHRLAVFVLLIFGALIAVMVAITTARIIREHFPRAFMSPSFRHRSRTLAPALYGSCLVVILFASGVLDQYQTGAYFNGTSPYFTLGNLAVSLTRSVGFLSPLALVGIAFMVRVRNKSFSDYLLVTAPLALIPTLIARDYTGLFLSPFFALLIGIGCLQITHRTPRRLRPFVAVSFLVVVVLSATFAVTTELPRQSFMTEAQYTSGLYVRYRVNRTCAFNDGLLADRIASVSGGPVLPVGGATTPTYSADAMAFGFVESFPVEQVPPLQLTLDTDSLYSPIGVTVGSDWSVMLSTHLSPKATFIAERYNVSSICEDASSEGIYHTGWGKDYESPLLTDIYSARYKTYDAGDVRVWFAF